MFALVHVICILDLCQFQAFVTVSIFLFSLLSVLISQIGIDTIGPLPKTANGKKYIVTLINYFSKWPEACRGSSK